MISHRYIVVVLDAKYWNEVCIKNDKKHQLNLVTLKVFIQGKLRNSKVHISTAWVFFSSHGRFCMDNGNLDDLRNGINLIEFFKRWVTKCNYGSEITLKIRW